MIIFAVAVGLVLIGLVFKQGTKFQALTWGTIFMIQPFCAVFFPVHILPTFMQVLAHCFHITYFFEWLRAIHTGNPYGLITVLAAFVFNIRMAISWLPDIFSAISGIKAYWPTCAK